MGWTNFFNLLFSRSLSDIAAFYCGERSVARCVVLGPKKSSMYSSEYTSGFSGPAASHRTPAPSPRHERQCRTGSYRHASPFPRHEN